MRSVQQNSVFKLSEPEESSLRHEIVAMILNSRSTLSEVERKSLRTEEVADEKPRATVQPVVVAAELSGIPEMSGTDEVRKWVENSFDIIRRAGHVVINAKDSAAILTLSSLTRERIIEVYNRVRKQPSPAALYYKKEVEWFKNGTFGTRYPTAQFHQWRFDLTDKLGALIEVVRILLGVNVGFRNVWRKEGTGKVRTSLHYDINKSTAIDFILGTERTLRAESPNVAFCLGLMLVSSVVGEEHVAEILFEQTGQAFVRQGKPDHVIIHFGGKLDRNVGRARFLYGALSPNGSFSSRHKFAFNKQGVSYA